MKKGLRKLSLVMAFVVLFSCLAVIPASAASYPSILFMSIKGDSFVEGTVGTLHFSVIRKYNNEKYYVEVYDSSDNLVGATSGNLYSYQASIMDISIAVDTEMLDMKPGKYYVKYYMEFYTMYNWYRTPNTYTGYFEVVPNTCNGNHSYAQSYIITEPTCSEEGFARFECSKCGHKYCADIPAADHVYGTPVVYESTCESEGYEIYDCENCTYSYTKTLPLAPHAFDEYSYASEDEHEATCSDCGEIKTLSHNWVIVDSDSDTGDATCECSDCGYERSESLFLFLGDINDDGEIDSKDYSMLKRSCFGTYTLSYTGTIAADVDSNGEINSKDYVLVKRHCFGTYEISPEIFG